MILFVLIMLLTYAGVAYERFHKTVAALLGAGVLTLLGVLLGVFEYHQIYEFLKEDLNVFGVIIGTGILVDVTGKSGLFHFLSMLIVRATGERATWLYLAICGLTFLFVAVLTIVPAMLILCSLVLVICRSLNYNPKPFLLSVAICANSGAIVTFASGLPNIMIGTAAQIPYVHFLIVSAPYALISFIMAIAVLRFAFRKDLPWKQTAEERAELKARIAEFDPWALVESRRVLLRSGAILMATVLGFAFAQFLGLGMDFIAMAGGTAALLFAGRSVEDTISKVNWTVILFFMGLFLIIGSVKATGALDLLARQVVAVSGGNVAVLISLLTVFSAFASSIVDNIPVAATLIPLVQNISGPDIPAEPLWWSLVIGCNLGGNGTPIGSISCVIALYTLKKEAHITVGWGEFIKLGGTIMLIQTAGAIVYLLFLQMNNAFPQL
jgi:Na+/H+ antiporter NhaD/arsenite permease-like protein